MLNQPPEISLVIPMYNEEVGVDLLLNRIQELTGQWDFSCEIVIVNDGSRDRTVEKLKEWLPRLPQLRIIDLSRNFGKDTALTAGLMHATGNAVVPLDADLQDPPEIIPQMVAKWKTGYDVVYARREERNADGITKKITAGWFYRIFNSVSQIKIPENAGDFRLMDRKVIEAIQRLPEHNRFMKGLFAWVGFDQTEVTYIRPARAAGTTKWNYWKLWNFAIDGITSFSTLPLRIWTYIGFAVATSSFIYAGIILLRTLFWGRDWPGYASLMIAILILGGLQMISLGVLGEYLGRTYLESKRRPNYLVKKIYRSETHDSANTILNSNG